MSRLTTTADATGSGIEQPGPKALAQAAEWFVLLASGEASDDERGQWHAWRAAHPSHEAAWQRATTSISALAALPTGQAKLACEVLHGQPKSPGRRRFATQLAALLAVGGSAWFSYRQSDRSADFVTAVGEQRDLRLADGSLLQMDTDSAVDAEFSAKTRLLHLRRGRIMVETTPDPAVTYRPFVVATADGWITALGTRFSVQIEADGVRVAVLEKRVAIEPDACRNEPLILSAGETARFDRRCAIKRGALTPTETAWTQGMLVADDLRLADLVSQLARYRAAPLLCAPETAELRISGSFPLRDIERTLAALANTLPVRIVQDDSGGILLAGKK